MFVAQDFLFGPIAIVNGYLYMQIPCLGDFLSLLSSLGGSSALSKTTGGHFLVSPTMSLKHSRLLYSQTVIIIIQ